MEDILWCAVGGWGRWQGVVFATFFYALLVGIWQNYAMTFLAPNQHFRCAEDYNATAEQCAVLLPDGSERPCARFEYDDMDTLVSQFDLVCSREWLVSFSKSVYMMGFMASVFVFGQVSDWIGRLPTIRICFVIMCVATTASMFVTSFSAFLVFRFLQAVGRVGFTTTGYVLLMEIVGPDKRTFVGLAVQLGWSLGLVLLALIGYFFRHWFWFQVATALPFLPLAAALFFIPESFRWLLVRRHFDRLGALVEVAARRNGKRLNEEPAQIVQRLAEASTQEERSGTLVDLFRTPSMRWRTLNMMYLWLVNAFLYYALSFNTNEMWGDPLLNFLLCGLLEFPSYAFLYPSIRIFGRRPTVVAIMLALGAACLALIAAPAEPAWVSTALSLLGKFLVTASFGALYLYTGELFPTVIRSAALGTCSTVARLGSIVAPFSREMGKASHPSVPHVLFAALSISSGIFALRLPETAGRRLPDTLETDGQKQATTS